MMRKIVFTLFMIATSGAIASPSIGQTASDCAPGVYRANDRNAVIISRSNEGDKDLGYVFLDGRRGKVSDRDVPFRCRGSDVLTRSASGAFAVWRKVEFRTTPTHFKSGDLTLNGLLIEPMDASASTPLAVFVHGSEKTGWVGHISYPYVLAAQGISAFIFDKRGTGDSQGTYTQNFELLADDAAAAANEARRLAAGRFGRLGLLGGSQGGWVAPAAANRAHADFVVVTYGLVLTPLEEDSEQVFDELRSKGYGNEAIAQAREVTDATDEVMASHFTTGFDKLAAAKQKYANAPWLHQIKGEFTGDLLAADEATLRKDGAARYDNLGIDWHYDAKAVLRSISMPQLWVLAGEDREAPNLLTQRRLGDLVDVGKPIDIAIFPNTDHGIYEFTEDADGTRHITRHPEGYFRLLGDWIKGTLHAPYGPAQLKLARSSS